MKSRTRRQFLRGLGGAALALPWLVSNSLAGEGVLWLGSSESLGDQAPLYSVLDSRWKLFSARADRARSIVVPLSTTSVARQARERGPDRPEMGPLAETMLRDYLVVFAIYVAFALSVSVSLMIQA